MVSGSLLFQVAFTVSNKMFKLAGIALEFKAHLGGGCGMIQI